MEEALEIYSHQLHVTKGSDSEIPVFPPPAPQDFKNDKILSLLTKGLQQMIV